MFSTRNTGGNSPLAALQRLATKQTPAEQCDFCSLALGPVHRHLLEVSTRKILCTCDPCGLRFDGVVGGKYKLIPRRARVLPGFQITDAQWASLALPIDLAFIHHSSPHGRAIALYPSPGGVIESLLPLASWDELVAENPPLQKMEPDVEACLVNRTGKAREYFLAPIDACFELSGLVRLHWRGLTGGTAVWKEVASFFSRLRTGAAPAELGSRPEVTHA